MAPTPSIRPVHRWWRCGRVLRGVAVAAAVGAVGWTSLESRRVERQERIGSQLAPAGLFVLLEEPTAVGQLLRKVAPAREPWLAGRLGAGWFGRPTVLVADGLSDERVAGVSGLIYDLGSVREVHLREPKLSETGVSTLRAELPGIGIAFAHDPGTQRYFRGRVEQPQFAFGGAMLAALLAVSIPAAALLAGWRAVRAYLPRCVSG